LLLNHDEPLDESGCPLVVPAISSVIVRASDISQRVQLVPLWEGGKPSERVEQRVNWWVAHRDAPYPHRHRDNLLWGKWAERWKKLIEMP
jgi:hypothetical protein